MKYSEAKQKIEALSSKYDINMTGGDFNVNYKNLIVAWVKNDKRYSLYNHENAFKKLPFSNKLYMILSELAITPLDKRVETKKYYVKIFNGLLLNVNTITGMLGIHSATEAGTTKTKFTDEEIEQLKRRDDIPLDWNKVILEEAE